MLSATRLAVLPAPLHYHNLQFQKTEGLLHHLSYDMSWRPDLGALETEALETEALGQPWTAFRGYTPPPPPLCSYWTLPSEGTKGEGPRDDTDSTSMAHTTGPTGSAVPKTDPAAEVSQDVVGLAAQDVVGLAAQDTPSDSSAESSSVASIRSSLQGHVLGYIGSGGSNQNLILKKLTHNLATLFALANASQVSEIHGPDLRYMERAEGIVSFKLTKLLQKTLPSAA